MSFQTTAFAAQDALVTALDASASLSAWTVQYGLPSGRPDDLHIWVDESIEDGKLGEATTGLVTRSETYLLTVYVYDRKTGATALEIRDEISVAGGVIAAIVGSSPFLGGAVMYAEIVAYAYEGAFADPEGRVREGVLKVTIACDAHLTA